MCGIIGYFSNKKVISDEDFKGMTNCLSHRGPDATGTYFYKNSDFFVGLGHKRLSILDLSTSANQPFFSSCGNFAIIFNGEIYNFKELGQRFGIIPKTTSDTEIILELFIKLGPSFVSLLNGMFAFAIYDIQMSKFYLYRDRLGVKPLFYLKDASGVIFASELKSLLANESIVERLTINKKSINLFMHLGFIPHPYTIYNEINKFPAGCYAEMEGENFKIVEYWKPEEKITGEVERSFVRAKNQLKELLEDSIRLRLISDVPLGTFLSGGIDSSLVTAIAQKISSEPVKTFSIGFKESSFNETGHARKIASFLKTDHHEYTVSEKDAQSHLVNVMAHFDEPFADTSALPTLLVSKMAREHVTVVLTGDGGDECFMGYGAYNWARRFSKPEFNLVRKPLSSALLAFGNSRLKRIGQMLDLRGSKNIRTHIFSQEQYYYSENELAQLLKPEFVVAVNVNLDLANLSRSLGPEEEQALFDLSFYLPDDLLVKVDRASMLCSLEAREPMLDYRIVEFSLNLAKELKIQGAVSKYLLKEVLYDYIPGEYFNRPKWGFAVPLAKWLKGDMAYLIEGFLSEEKILKVGVLQPEYVKSLIKRFRKGEDYLFNRIWQAIILQGWFLKWKMD